jgi:hypothetical protein
VIRRLVLALVLGAVFVAAAGFALWVALTGGVA